MYFMKQGDIADAKRITAMERRIDELEKRIQMLENVAKPLQSEQRPRMGRPPKVRNEQTTESQTS